ncbi:MAG: TIGR00730 family Rossman fold protein [Leptolyngbya sp. PLA2]|nr:TIGR00730 family Rossman fold protein [Leptolyngbya sp.]MCE7971883.1 TIGR00730 family Rossman fold protein [Leptolyngbya sp. PL-A2]MCZ7631997.1 TIGR00730 family Rossman fold protein [Phycisphaerales bacterium]MDL1904010.1 TIGR00730 family Rossman fold protein [Synechococcales cyanobacterium CNB]GIK18774.1 MAG: cytokinin riboside 5'-monophosphate phosphoribohydrolase [Planctomycetota bacterium]
MGRAVAVFCGSGLGARPEYAESARAVGCALAKRGVTLVYGGGGKGMMGALADGTLAGGGRVVGVIPHWMMEKEAAHTGVAEMRVVETMLERKTMMAELADAFLVLPGGLGTMDELFEMLTWSQLRLHGRSKPTGILNVAGFYDHLRDWLARATHDGYIRESSAGLPIIDDDADRLLGSLLT